MLLTSKYLTSHYFQNVLRMVWYHFWFTENYKIAILHELTNQKGCYKHITNTGKVISSPMPVPAGATSLLKNSSAFLWEWWTASHITHSLLPYNQNRGIKLMAWMSVDESRQSSQTNTLSELKWTWTWFQDYFTHAARKNFRHFRSWYNATLNYAWWYIGAGI